MYDAGNMLAEAGGNIGLMLGFSLLSVLLYVIKWCKKLIWTFKAKKGNLTKFLKVLRYIFFKLTTFILKYNWSKNNNKLYNKVKIILIVALCTQQTPF